MPAFDLTNIVKSCILMMGKTDVETNRTNRTLIIINE